MVAFNACLFTFYSLAPYVFRIAGATFLNLSLLTSDIYGFILGIVIFHAKMTVWYPVAFAWIAVGIVLYNSRQVMTRDETDHGDVAGGEVVASDMHGNATKGGAGEGEHV